MTITPITNIRKSTLVRGTAASDLIYGWGISDIEGTEAPSSLLNESFYAGTGNDTVYGGAGKDTLYGQDGQDWLYGGTGDDALYGGNDNDTLYAGTGNDLLYGEAGNDDLRGESGADTLSGGLGNDQFDGGDGNDRLAGDEGDDTLYGGDGNDALSGGADNDWLDGGAGADTIDGGFGSDTVSYANSSAAVSVNLLTRINTGGDAQGDSLIGIENLVGSAFADTLVGNSGNNTLQGGSGADALDGGTGNDTASYAGSNAAVQVNLQTGTGTGGHAEGDTLVGIENLIGSEFGDTLVGNAEHNHLEGGNGDDTLTGAAGADLLDGGTGSDTASYVGSNAAVQVNLQTGTGTGGHAQGDTLVGIENLVGSEFGDTLVGNAEHNHLEGGNGDDTLTGAAGADLLDGGTGSDTASYAGSNAAVQVNLQTGTGTGGHAEGDTLVGIENLIGSEFGDTLTGNSGNNTLDGGAGADILRGGGGNDRFVYSATNQFGDTIFDFQGFNSYYLYDAGGTSDLIQISDSMTTGSGSYFFGQGNVVLDHTTVYDFVVFDDLSTGSQNAASSADIAIALNNSLDQTSYANAKIFVLADGNNTSGDDNGVLWYWVDTGNGNAEANELTQVAVLTLWFIPTTSDIVIV